MDNGALVQGPSRNDRPSVELPDIQAELFQRYKRNFALLRSKGFSSDGGGGVLTYTDSKGLIVEVNIRCDIDFLCDNVNYVALKSDRYHVPEIHELSCREQARVLDVLKGVDND